MLRTVVIARNDVVRNSLKKAIKTNFTRCLSIECNKKTQLNRLSNPLCERNISVLQWKVPYQMRHYASLPEHEKVALPALSPTMESGSVISWAKKEGDKLEEGDLLCEIETDKATMGFETPSEGYLAKIIIPAGTKGVPVGKLLCIIVEKESDVAPFKDYKGDEEAPAATPQAAPAAPTPAAAVAAAVVADAASAPSAGGRVFASPMARRLAEIRNVRLQGSGSGLYDSLKSGDLSTAPAESISVTMSPGASYIDIPLSSMRATIAKRLTHSKQTVPHYQLSVTVDITKTLQVRGKVNKQLESQKSDVKISINDYIIKAVASACKRVPAVNAAWMDTFIRQFNTVDVSVAVATPTGLITPIIFNADSRGVIDISKSVKELAKKAKDGKLKPEEFQGGTVTISNLGMFGITEFNAIINPPQSLILACGGVQELVVPDKDQPHGWRVGKFVTFTASADHRVIDGAVGAQFMKAFKSNMEDPANIIL